MIIKPSDSTVVVPEEVVMQPRFTVAILVLQPEWLVRRSHYVRFALQFTPTVIISEPNQIAFIIGYLSRSADLVAVEVVDFLFAFAVCVGPVAELCQGFVAVGIGIEIGISAVRLDFLQEVAAVPNESGFLFEAV